MQNSQTAAPGWYIQGFAKAVNIGPEGDWTMKFSRWFTGICCLAVFVVSVARLASADAKVAPTITIALDATEAPRKILHAKLVIPAKAGSLTLYYPKWIPGEHEPSGPIQSLTGLHFKANGQELTWRRDLLDAWTFHVEVPSGVSSVDVALDYLFPAPF